MKHKKHLFLRRQFPSRSAGVSLLYAVLALGIVAVISFAIGSLTLRGLRQARDVGYGLVAYYAAETGIERALYEVLVLGNTGDSGWVSLDTLPDGRWNYTVNVSPNDSYTYPSLKVDEVVQFDNITQTDLYIQWGSDAGGTANDLVEVTYVWWDDLSGDGYDTSSQHVIKEVFTYNDLNNPPYNGEIHIAMAGINHLVRIKALRDTVSNLRVRIPGHTFDDRAQIVSVGEYLKHQQALQVDVSSELAVSGFFDYVIFSKSNLKKE